ncbi:MAG: hypothetical protein ACTHK2_15020 [Dokdonella sp.]|uniref:hypothetical protein n=1 Tax=Dokdonella sp. TaxID=2291710 RepID=UPI003F7FF9DC
MPHAARPLSLLSVFVVLLGASSASAQYVFVGPASDPDCDYPTIQAALDAWAASPSTDFLSIYVTSAQAYTATAITIPTPVASAGVALSGGMPSCHLQGASGHVVLDGAGNGGVPVIDVDGAVAGDGHRFEVTIGPLEITGGNHAGNGGGVRVRGNVVVTLFEADVHDNTATNGGGVSVEATAAGAPQLILVGNQAPAAMRDNTATQDGGGIYCMDASVYCDRYCGLAGNQAGGRGGGIAQQACATALYPSPSMVIDPEVGIRSNVAVGDGGGVWASGGYFNIGAHTPLKPVPVSGNSAGGSGGGLYLTGVGAGSSLSLRGVHFDDNSADGDGGALYADTSLIMVDAPIVAGCGGAFDGCPRFSGNHAGGSGGALALYGDASLLAWNLVFANNDAAHASVLQIGAAPAAVTLIDTHVAGNHGAPELLRSSGAQVDLRYVTIADEGGDDDALIRFDAAGVFAAANSILWDDNGAASGVVLAAPAGSTFNVDCVLVHEDSALGGQPGVTDLVVADPAWDMSGAWPAGMYVPGADSPVVDACGAGPGNIADLIGTTRPQDLPKADAAGAYDMGAIERRPDVVFADGFELP